MLAAGPMSRPSGQDTTTNTRSSEDGAGELLPAVELVMATHHHEDDPTRKRPKKQPMSPKTMLEPRTMPLR
jgi:hypothetical protein